jgi:hypothetical protein
MDSESLKKLKKKDLPETLQYIMEELRVPDNTLAKAMKVSLTELGGLAYEDLEPSDEKFKSIRKTLVSLVKKLENIENSKYRI